MAWAGSVSIYANPFGELLSGIQQGRKDRYDAALKDLQIRDHVQKFQLRASAEGRTISKHAADMGMDELRKEYMRYKLDKGKLDLQEGYMDLDQRRRDLEDRKNGVNRHRPLPVIGSGANAAAPSPTQPPDALPAPHVPPSAKPLPGVKPAAPSAPAKDVPTLDFGEMNMGANDAAPQVEAPAETKLASVDGLNPDDFMNWDDDGEGLSVG